MKDSAVEAEKPDNLDPKLRPKKGRRKSKKGQNGAPPGDSASHKSESNDLNDQILAETEAQSVKDRGAPHPKMDAFQFMMSSRHKSIGRNSPGRDLDLNQSTDSVLAKQELKTRRSKLEKWAEKKGAARRRIEEEDREEVIGRKLEKRGRRMKRMLNIDCQSDDEVITRKKRKCVIESDEEEVKKDEKLTPRSVRSWKLKIRLQMDENKENGENEEDGGDNENAKIEEVEEKLDVNLEIEEVEEQNSSLLDFEEKSECVLEEKPNRRSSRIKKPKSYDDYFLSDDEESSKKKKPVKLAPVFLKSVPKPKLDPQVIEARRQFLLSGVPSSLKKEMEKQQSVEDFEFDVFPAISHVQQKTSDVFWNLPPASLVLKETQVETIEHRPFCQSLLNLSSCATKEKTLTKVKNVKKIIKEIKCQNPDYPVFKIFNSFYRDAEEEKSRRRGRPKKNETPKEVPTKQPENPHAMWTEKYKPKSSSDIVGNHGSASSLKTWLKNWNLSDLKQKKEDSESEFYVTDCDSRDSGKMVGNTVLLKGPTGSGKTAAVYAICQELSLNVLEVNASSKRTGKRLLQELQEATQSHQVCKKTALPTLLKEKEKSPNDPKCVLFIEDVDVVFEQDEGFSAALSQIMATSKRPIILTSTDEPSTSLKFLNNVHTIIFSQLSPSLAVWLQIVCLVEGLYVNSKSLERVLSFNRGDIRRTLLQLQLYVNSGFKVTDASDVGLGEDSNSQLDEEGCHIDQAVEFSNLEVVWWNLPAVLNLPDLSALRLSRINCLNSEKPDKQKIRDLSNCYETLSFFGVLNATQFCDSLEKRWRAKTKDGLGLEEVDALYKDEEFCHDLSQTFLTRSINHYKEKYDTDSSFNMAVPVLAEKRWRSKMISSEEKLQEALQVSEFLSRKAVVLDYMPALRAIARSEFERAANNTKRGNRFYNYLRNLGVRCSDSSYRLVSDVFKVWE